MRASLVIAALVAIGAATGCGSASGGHETRVAIHAVVRAGCSAGPTAAGRPYPGSIVVTGAGRTKAACAAVAGAASRPSATTAIAASRFIIPPNAENLAPCAPSSQAHGPIAAYLPGIPFG